MMLFVYGTLKKGEWNHTLLRMSKYMGKDSITGTLYDLGGLPAITLEGDKIIKGEVYEIDEHTLKALDYLESYPAMYDRTLIRTNKNMKCIVYFMHKVPENSEVIKEWKSQ